MHLQIGEQHEYFGSIEQLFCKYNKNQLGFSIYQVRNNLKKIGKNGILSVYNSSRSITDKTQEIELTAIRITNTVPYCNVPITFGYCCY